MKLLIWNSFVAHGTNQIRQLQSMKRGQEQTNWDTTTLLQKVSSTITMKMQVSTGSLWMHNITSNSAIFPMPAVRRKSPRPVENAIIHDNATTNSGGAITKILQYWSGKCHSTLPVLSPSVHMTRFWSPYKSIHCVRNNLLTEKGSEQQLGAKQHRLAHQVIPTVFANLPVTGNKL